MVLRFNSRDASRRDFRQADPYGRTRGLGCAPGWSSVRGSGHGIPAIRSWHTSLTITSTEFRSTASTGSRSISPDTLSRLATRLRICSPSGQSFLSTAGHQSLTWIPVTAHADRAMNTAGFAAAELLVGSCRATRGRRHRNRPFDTATDGRRDRGPRLPGRHFDVNVRHRGSGTSDFHWRPVLRHLPDPELPFAYSDDSATSHRLESPDPPRRTN